uniref:DNA-directed RNA polymerase subunit alpha n=1 Tax=Pyrola rotundifolia TaxID=13651 RepID=A0A1B1CZM5_9ERIC|nr:RNA polymerase alpha subunit [Pyrola rotundifolia]
MSKQKQRKSSQRLEWQSIYSRVDSKRFYYERFMLFPLRKGQADTIGSTLRRALLGEIEATCITRAHFLNGNVKHEYSTIGGIQESVHEILMNLKEIVLKSNLYGTCDAFLSLSGKGPQNITAQNINTPSDVEIVDKTQHIATLTESIDLDIRLEIEKNCGYRIESPTNNFPNGSYAIDAVFKPVLNVNYNIFPYGSENEKNEKDEILCLEISTNGSLTPKEALYEASWKLIDLFIPFLHTEEENIYLDHNQHKVTLPLFNFYERFAEYREFEIKSPYPCCYIDQLELPPRIYNCLVRTNLYSVWNLLNATHEDFMKIEDLGIEDIKQIAHSLEKYIIDQDSVF